MSEGSEELKGKEEDLSNDEFDAEETDINNEFNQETEEELLDIPTFLRRQAN